MTDNWNMLGHEWAVEMLQHQVAHDTARHAYLFTGPPGVGRRTLALRFAQALNCTQPVEQCVPCGGTCRDCKQIEAMQHPDLTIIQADSVGGVLTVDKVRAARRTMMLKPFQSKYRVAIFLRFQEANDSAANALLKTLEEAPSYVVLILTADNTEQLLPTIVSRCEVLHLRPLSLQIVESFLKQKAVEGKPVGDDTRLLSHLSGGRPGYALRLMQDPSALAFRGQKLDDLLSLLSASRQQKFSYAEKLAGDRDGMRSALVLWLSFWRDVFLRAGSAAAPMENIDRTKEIESLTKRISMSEAHRLVAGLEEALGRLEANVNARLLAEVLLLDWPRI